MKTRWPLVLITCLFAIPVTAQESDSRLYELRIYTAAEDKLSALHTRFRDHTMKLFEKHGMTNIGYWVPVENADNQLIYLMAYPNREARDRSWKAFISDPDWKKAYAESRADGPLVTKVESLFLEPTDYSPPIKPAGKGGRLFELRHYTASEGNLDNLNARFRDHTVELFKNHGMTNFGYWNLTEGQKGAENTLIYILAHKDDEARNASFAAFREDPKWLAARKASEEKAGGSLTTKGGVQSTLMKPTDYSPTK